MHEKIPADKGNAYVSSRSLFEVFKNQIPRQLERARLRKDSSRITELEQQEKEVDVILRSLETGDTEPARRTIVSMIEQNLEDIRLGVPNGLVDETFGERIRRLASYLIELEKAGQKAELASPPVEMQSRDKAEKALWETKLDGPEITELTRSIAELEAAEEEIRKSLVNIKNQRNRLNEFLRSHQLSKLKKDIVG